MQAMGNLDYFFVADELEQGLKNAHLNKIYATEEGKFRFKLRSEGKEMNLIAELGKRVHLTKYIEETEGEPSSFVMFLRKKLGNGKITSIVQRDFDRILEIRIEKEEKYTLVLEMAGKGNVILCDEKGEIISAFKMGDSFGREIRAKREYALPPMTKKQPEKLEEKDFDGLKGKVVSAISKVVNVAPFYLEEICIRNGISLETKIEELEKKQLKKIAEEIASVKGQKAEPTVYYEKESGKPNAFSPFQMKKLEKSGEAKTFASFSEALDEYYANAEEKKEIVKRRNPEIEKLEISLESQRKALEECGKEDEGIRKMAEAIYANYELVERAIEIARKMKREKKKDEEIENMLREKGISAKISKYAMELEVS